MYKAQKEMGRSRLVRKVGVSPVPPWEGRWGWRWQEMDGSSPRVGTLPTSPPGLHQGFPGSNKHKAEPSGMARRALSCRRLCCNQG